jgi:hypothetical protein
LTYGGGYKRRGTFIEYSKKFIDLLNAYNSEQASLRVTEFTKTVDSIHYYDSIIVVEKRQREKPFSMHSGTDSFLQLNSFQRIPNNKLRFFRKKGLIIHRFIVKLINQILRFFRLPGFIWR